MPEYRTTRINVIGNTDGINVGINNATINNQSHHYGDLKSLKQLAEDTDANKGKKRYTGTCQWLLYEPDYQIWFKMESQYSVFWIHGHVGCGKTTLMSRVIQDVRNINEQPDSQEKHRTVHLLHFYVDFPTKGQQEHFYGNMLKTFWEQTKNSEWSSSRFSNAPDDEIQEELNLLLANTQSDVYIVIDALDQLHEKSRRKVLRGLNLLVEKHKEKRGKYRLAIIISSRDLTGYDQLQGYNQLEFRIQPHHSTNDIKVCLEKELDSDLFDKHRATKADAVSKLTEVAKGMFLWATLQAKNLSEISSFKSSRVAGNLENLRLPEEMSKIYQEYVEGFESLKDEVERQIALRTIALLSQERESIPKTTLLTAVSLKATDGRVDSEIYEALDEEPAKIVPICNHLIELDENLGIFRLSHTSIFEFFQSHKRDVDYRRISELSLAHLCSSEFSGGPDKDATWFNYGTLGSILQKHPFLEYASCNWAVNMRKGVESESMERRGEEREREEKKKEIEEREKMEKKKQEGEKRESERMESAELQNEEIESEESDSGESGESEESEESEESDSVQQKSLVEMDLRKSHSGILSLLEKLFETSGEKSKQNLQLSFQVHLLSLGKLLPAGVCHDHIVSYFALYEFFDVLHENRRLDVTRLDEEGSTAIHWAIRNETERNDRRRQTVQRLIEYGANIDAEDKRGCTPLYYASLYGNLKVVELLLKRGANLNIQNKENETALIAACKEHHHKVIKRLLAVGANVRIQGSGGTALQAVSLVGCHTCVKRILGRFANDTPGRGHWNIIKSLSTKSNVWFKRNKNMTGKSEKALITEENGPVGTALHAAAFYGHLMVVKLLCERHFDVRTTHDTYGSVLTAAVLGCEPDMSPKIFSKICEKLIHRGVDVNDTSGVLGPALHAAAFHGHSELVQLLLDNGAKIHLAEGQMGTAYQTAHERGHENIKKLLLEKDEKADTYGKSDMQELLKARQKFHRGLFTIALKAGNIITINGLIQQFVKLVKSEIDKGRSPFLKTLANVGKECFNDIIKLATMASAKTDAEANKLSTQRVIEEDGSTRKQRYKNTSKELGTRIRDMISTLSCTGQAEEEEISDNSMLSSVPAAPLGLMSADTGVRSTTGGPASMRTSLRRQTTALERDTLTGRFPEVLNGLTEAAVNILEYAISNGDAQKIKVVADTWIDALNNLILCDGFGEPMLRKVVQARAYELKKHLHNTEIGADKRLENAENLARVGTELLLSAAARGPGFKLLSFTLSALWVGAFNEVADDDVMLQLIRTISSRFLKTISTPKDPVNGRIIGQAVLELLKAAALCTQRQWMDGFTKGWVRLWTLASERRMGDVINESVIKGLDEYKTCVEGRKYDEALGLALASISLLRVATEQRSISVIQTLLAAIESGFTWSMEPERLKTHTNQQGGCQQLDIGRIFDAIVSLFATAEKNDPGRLRTFALKILESIKTISEADLQASHGEIGLVYQRLQATEKKTLTPELRAQHRLQLMHMSMAITYLRDTALEEKAGPNIVSVLKNLASKLPMVGGEKLD